MDAEPTEDLGNPSLDQERAAKLGEEIQTVKHISGNTCRFGLWLIRFEHLVPSITSVDFIAMLSDFERVRNQSTEEGSMSGIPPHKFRRIYIRILEKKKSEFLKLFKNIKHLKKKLREAQDAFADSEAQAPGGWEKARAAGVDNDHLPYSLAPRP